MFQGVAGAAAIMIAATIGVCGSALEDLYTGLALHDPPRLAVGPTLFAVLLGGVALKLFLFLLCRRAAATAPPGAGDALAALAEDHRVDILANSVAALSSAAVLGLGPGAWPVDPVAALLLSAYILVVWTAIFSRTVGKIVGRAAPPEVMAALEAVVLAQSRAGVEDVGPEGADFTVDVLKAWFSGEALYVEAEVIMHPETPLRVSHDVALRLQHALEAASEGDTSVERAYVHVDYARRAEPEHAPDRAAAAAGARQGSV